ncbi:MAG: hypothetical protein ABR910_15500 [Acidobacteriaceae bacterium]|jgi:hypothetical protein
MKSYPAPPIPEATIAAMQQLVDGGASQTELIAALRDAGLSIVPSIKLLSRFYRLSSSDAKSAVHLSETWANCRESNDALHDTAETAARELGFKETTTAVAREQVAR